MVADSTILAFQFFATLFMAADYFLDSDQRKAVDGAIHRVVKPVQQNIDRDIKQTIDSVIIQQWVGITVALALLILSWLGAYILKDIAEVAVPGVIAVLSLLFLAMFAGAMPKLMDVLVKALIPLTIAAPLRLVTTFLIRCPKGSVFGIGFVLLMASFAFRYANLQ